MACRKSIGTWLSMACIWLTMVLKEPHVAPSRICLTKVRENQGQRKYLVWRKAKNITQVS
ncbi:Uncharacterised protein [Vibrio cholerae]|nr:Uncharacterised protein [Vibrio cholerae]CSI86540.1 Uncharacterised protein [Vibrio cholerae]